MGAKESVMNDTLIQVWVLEFIQPGELDFNAKLKEFAQAQAEISFKAGVREVIEWTAREFGVDWSSEKEQLKEWGIEWIK